MDMLLIGATASNQFCAQTADIWQFVGYILVIFKIVIPLILLILGMVDLGKAVVASDDKAIKNATKSLAMRAIAAVVIFFIPTLIGFVFSIVNGFNEPEIKANYDRCRECIVNPYDDTKCNDNDITYTKKSK